MAFDKTGCSLAHETFKGNISDSKTIFYILEQLESVIKHKYKRVVILDAEVLWRLYMTLLKAEAGFKILKGTFGLRPSFHQKEKLVDGHIFITVLAYHLLCWINMRVEKFLQDKEITNKRLAFL